MKVGNKKKGESLKKSLTGTQEKIRALAPALPPNARNLRPIRESNPWGEGCCLKSAEDPSKLGEGEVFKMTH